MNPLTAKADKCDMCYERQLQGKTTICVSACPVTALEIIDINDPKYSHYDKAIYGYEMKKMTNPSIRFHKIKVDIQHFGVDKRRLQHYAHPSRNNKRLPFITPK